MDESQNTIPKGNEATDIDLIAKIQELRDTTVPQGDYDALKEKYNALVKSVVDGDDTSAKEVPPVDIKKLRLDLFSRDATPSNLEYITKALALRDALIESGEPDPFLPYGKTISPTAADVEAVDRVVKVFKEAVEYADGDSQIFTQELQRRTADTKKRK